MIESEMIERSSAYALTSWGAERVNMGVLDTLDLILFFRREAKDRKEFSPFPPGRHPVYYSGVNQFRYFLFTVIFIKDGYLTVRVVIKNCAVKLAMFITGIFFLQFHVNMSARVW